ncbi:hypothetical protein KM043_004822 [Ampulex compressa]|nr:hypothetical protein KM043_004822 [Ampulex compressa]
MNVFEKRTKVDWEEDEAPGPLERLRADFASIPSGIPDEASASSSAEASANEAEGAALGPRPGAVGDSLFETGPIRYPAYVQPRMHAASGPPSSANRVPPKVPGRSCLTNGAAVFAVGAVPAILDAARRLACFAEWQIRKPGSYQDKELLPVEAV